MFPLIEKPIQLIASNVRVWDRLAGTVESTFPIQALHLEKHVQLGTEIMEYGCGDGRVLLKLREFKPSRLVGYDVSSKMCELARSRVPEAEVELLRNSFDSYLGNKEFDVVLLVGVLSSIVGFTERKKLVFNISRCAKPNGIIIIADFGRSKSAYYKNRYDYDCCEPFTFKTAEGLWIHHFSSHELNELINDYAEIYLIQTTRVRTIHKKKIPGHIVVAKRKIEYAAS